MIRLDWIAYDPKARDGSWCCSPYPGHSHGCPNFPKGCTSRRPDFRNIAEDYHWYAVIEEFDLKAHTMKMKAKHPDWSDRQCRNPLYWQGSVRKALKRKAQNALAKLTGFTIPDRSSGILLDIPEACGIDVFKTMAKAGISLERHPDTVRKVMIVGCRDSTWGCHDLQG